MTRQEYQHIKILSRDLLIDAKISSFPVDIRAIARLYKLQEYLDYSRSRYVNTVALSKRILEIYGYNVNLPLARHMAVRILSPMIVLLELRINSIEELSKLTELPSLPATLRFNCYRKLVANNSFASNHIDKRILKQFENWIINRQY